MDMLLMGLCMSLLGVAVCIALFAAASHGEAREGASQVMSKPALPLPAPQFFVDDAHRTAPPRVALDTLLLQLESHIRLEQAAAESFLHVPTSESLHSPTTSPLVH